MGKVCYCESFALGCFDLPAIRRNEKVRLIGESAPDVKSIERPQGILFEAADRLLKGFLGEVTEIGVGEVGLNGGFETPIVLGGKFALTHQPAQSRDQLGYDEGADPQGIRRSERPLTCSDPSSTT